MLLTEGAVSGIDKGGSYKIISFYVSSPLVWGIHVPADSHFQTMEEVQGQRYAISRYGSGSHLMSFVDAKNRNWPLEALRFELVGNLDGARQTFKEKKAEIFLWEKFTTKPYVDNGEFRRIDECPTPYDCFVICASQKALEKKEKAIYQTIKKVFKAGGKLYKDPKRSAIIANHYNLMETDVEVWLDSVRWTPKVNLEKKTLKKVISTLSGLDLINPNLKYKDLIWKLGKQ
jgi:ABC-type nitrate/sulfonate/bicarbonate transport system substrate-binding protein